MSLFNWTVGVYDQPLELGLHRYENAHPGIAVDQAMVPSALDSVVSTPSFLPSSPRNFVSSLTEDGGLTFGNSISSIDAFSLPKTPHPLSSPGHQAAYDRAPGLVNSVKVANGWVIRKQTLPGFFSTGLMSPTDEPSPVFSSDTKGKRFRETVLHEYFGDIFPSSLLKTAKVTSDNDLGLRETPIYNSLDANFHHDGLLETDDSIPIGQIFVFSGAIRSLPAQTITTEWMIETSTREVFHSRPIGINVPNKNIGVKRYSVRAPRTAVEKAYPDTVIPRLRRGSGLDIDASNSSAAYLGGGHVQTLGPNEVFVQAANILPTVVNEDSWPFGEGPSKSEDDELSKYFI